MKLTANEKICSMDGWSRKKANVRDFIYVAVQKRWDYRSELKAERGDVCSLCSHHIKLITPFLKRSNV